MRRNKKIPLFYHENGLCFGYSGGRFLIGKVETLEWSDLGDGKGSNRSGSIEHRFLGTIQGNESTLHFLKYNVSFNFDTLQNCHFLTNYRVLGEKLYPLPEIHYFIRFMLKHQNKTNGNTL